MSCVGTLEAAGATRPSKVARFRLVLAVNVRNGHFGTPNLRHAFLIAVALRPSSSDTVVKGFLNNGLKNSRDSATGLVPDRLSVGFPFRRGQMTHT
mmetsp:Transcript_34658/g.71553  ORF Transcript_34658/g.71553 Transcript_34658/m.71553 type:complete len:96 (+) Transcript_34658:286-573(+)